MKTKRVDGQPSAPIHYGIEERVGLLFQPDTLAMEEYLGNCRRKAALEPEKILVLAVLQDGIRCYQDNAAARNVKKKKLFEEAQQWVFGDDSEWLFSFTSVCSLLGFDPDYIRRGLKKWEAQSRKAANREQPPSVVAARRLAG